MTRRVRDLMNGVFDISVGRRKLVKSSLLGAGAAMAGRLLGSSTLKAFGPGMPATANLLDSALPLGQRSNGSDRTPVTAADMQRWEQELSNWGRWGKDDEIGAFNLITPAKRRQAAALVREGYSVSLASNCSTEKDIDNPVVYEHTMQGLTSDRISVSCHGYHTHMDSLAHTFENGAAYNGYAPDKETVVREGGHTKNSILNAKNGVVTRGVLMDIPRLKGLKYLEPGTPIYVDDLEAWEKKAKVKAGSGDAVFTRIGRWARRAEKGPWVQGERSAGFDLSVIPWIRKRDIALHGSDGETTMHPTGVPEFPFGAHNFLLNRLGVHLLDWCDLEAISEECARRNRWEFLLVVAPLRIGSYYPKGSGIYPPTEFRGGTGSPVNPIAVL